MANEILYQTTLNDTLQLKQHFIAQNDKIRKWETVLYNTRTNDSLILDTMEDDRPLVPEEKSGTRQRYYRICGAVLYDHTIYAVYQNYGFVSLKCYNFSGPRSFALTEMPVNLAYLTDLWGPPEGYAAFTRINDDIYFFLEVKRVVDPNLFKFSPKTAVISRIRFQDQDLVQVATSANLFEQTELSRNDKYIQENLQPTIRGYQDVKNILSFRYLGFIEDEPEFEQSGSRYLANIYFFAELDNQLHIARYLCYEKEWLLSGFKEEPLQYSKSKPGRLR